MAALDWWVIGSYLVALLLLAAWLGRRQGTRHDYFLGGGTLSAPALATSILATQCSTNSLLGAPAFVGFAAGGGLIWLQYELAVPIAMLALAVLFPVVFRSHAISVYAFLEERLGRSTRLVASACFLVFRGIATGVTVYGVASVLSLITGIGYLPAVALLMGVTITYDVMGGMRAVVISDVIQMILLLVAVALALFSLAPLLIEHGALLTERSRPLLDDWGLAGRSDYGFWPMLFGGLFLYTAYYGCDQSQAQRLLAAADERALQRILVLNGLLRFPLVLAYCLLGLGLAAYGIEERGFLASLPLTADNEPNTNLVFPAYVLAEFAPGLCGLAIVGLFAAAMSSIDSSLNSLSASTLEDFAGSGRLGRRAERQNFLLSKLVTLLWGAFAVLFSFSVEHIAGTVLEAINKIGSVANGPLLGLFLLAIAAPRVGQIPALTGFGAGIATNIILWLGVPTLSWLWWNVSGCLVTLVAALGLATLRGAPTAVRLVMEEASLGTARTLVAAFVVMAVLLGALQWS